MSGTAEVPWRRERGTVVLISSVHWHFTWQRHHELAVGFARRGWDVVFVEPLPKRWPGWGEWRRVRGRLLGRREHSGTVRQVEPSGIRFLSPRMFPDTPAAVRLVNLRYLIPRLARLLRERIRSRPIVVWNFLPTRSALAFQTALHPDLTVYDCVTEWDHDPYMPPNVAAEEVTVSAADLVFADSPYLYTKMRRLRPEAQLLPPAVDLGAFPFLGAPRSSGARTGARRRPALCAYFGAIGDHLDLELLKAVSRQFRLLLIGPTRTALSDFGARCEWLGPMPRSDLAPRLASVDVLLLPYRLTAFSAGVIPSKTYECLALGKPIVATGLPGLGELENRGLVRLCKEADEFLTAIEDATHEAPEVAQRRRGEAERQSWSQRLDTVEDAIARALAPRVFEEPR